MVGEIVKERYLLAVLRVPRSNGTQQFTEAGIDGDMVAL
jgi:hypothetical protein